MSKDLRARELQSDTIVAAIVAESTLKSADKRDLYRRFSKRYLANISSVELSEVPVSSIAADVQQAWEFVQERKSSRPLIAFEEGSTTEQGRVLPTTVVRVLLDDKPFIVDSLRQALLRCGVTIKDVRNAVLFSGRRKSGASKDGLGRFGRLVDLAVSSDDDFSAESFCSIACARLGDDELKSVEAELRDTLNHVIAAVGGYKDMTAAAAGLRRNLLTNAEFLPVSEENVAESIEFIGWLVDNHFTFLGYEKYSIHSKGAESIIQLESDSTLGVSRFKSELKAQTKLSSLPGAAADFVRRPKLLSFAKSSQRSKVHRPVYYDYVLVKEFDKAGKVTHMHRFLGLYTSSVYFREALAIPLLRKKVSRALEKSGYTKNGHNMKDLLQVINTFPRDELFQISSSALLETAIEVTKIRDTGACKLFVRKDFYGRFVNCLVYIPRELFNTKSRLAIQSLLERRFEAEDVDFNTYLTESSQARIHLVFRVPKIRALKIDRAELEAAMIALIRPWEDEFMESLRADNDEAEAQAQYKQFAECFSPAYQETYTAEEAVRDVRFINEVAQTGRLCVVLNESRVERAEFSFKLFSLESQLMLSDVDPILENLGLRIISERTFSLRGHCSDAGDSAPRIWLHDFLVYRREPSSPLSEAGRSLFEQAFYAVWEGRADDDAYNSLVLSARLDWRQAALLRALGAYLKQIRFGYSQLFLAETLSKHAAVTSDLLTLFTLTFTPGSEPNKTKAARTLQRIERGIDSVTNLSEDSVLRGFLGLLKAMRRTNFFQRDTAGETKDYFSFKFEPRLIKGIPKPVPLFEIFVFSAKVEGVHLRGGKVARGGLRWSDRREDYRTEVLGLVKAQQVKNSVIVPVGAKGGFVVKAATPAADRAENQARGINAYKTFIAGLLDITDNLNQSVLVPPPDVVRLDEDDPYLVVAADKGTATFSDIANGIAASYEFWLGDGFASGGSNGYDHKAMGITAKGAWVSVQRHFRERGIDIQKDEISVIGIGDMSGDVFGNGMLLSQKIALIGAFNHLHIFVDPTPDSKASFKERKRLFRLAGSTWGDYKKELISAGGGVFDRSAKSITLSAAMRQVFGVDAATLTPDELISAMLKAPVDLLWNGGIGTYVKSENETHAQVGDKANDALRVDASQLRCVAIGEGGNLGMTQLARIEYGLRQGVSFTDFIDNSAGVDCSDHEVNIKILLNEVATQSPARTSTAKLQAERERSELLESMTEAVAELVLDNNYKQVQTLALTFADRSLDCKQFNDLVVWLEARAGLDRAIEYLPNAEALERRGAAGGMPTRPELAVVTSYMKMHLKEELVTASYLHDPMLDTTLHKAFPATLVERYPDAINQHPLRAELMATQIANTLLNRVGGCFIFELVEASGKSVSDVVRAALLACSVLEAEPQWRAIESLDFKVSVERQNDMMLRLIRLVREATRWLLRNRKPGPSLAAEAADYAPGIRELRSLMPAVLTEHLATRFEQEVQQVRAESVPAAIASAYAQHGFLSPALSLIETANACGESLETMTAAYHFMGAALQLDWLEELIAGIAPNSVWESQVRTTALEDLTWRQRVLARRLLRETEGVRGVQKRVDAWFAKNESELSRSRAVLSALQAEPVPDLAMVTVAMRELKKLS